MGPRLRHVTYTADAASTADNLFLKFWEHFRWLLLASLFYIRIGEFSCSGYFKIEQWQQLRSCGCGGHFSLSSYGAVAAAAAVQFSLSTWACGCGCNYLQECKGCRGSATVIYVRWMMRYAVKNKNRSGGLVGTTGKVVLRCAQWGSSQILIEPKQAPTHTGLGESIARKFCTQLKLTITYFLGAFHANLNILDSRSPNNCVPEKREITPICHRLSFANTLS